MVRLAWLDVEPADRAEALKEFKDIEGLSYLGNLWS